MSSTQTAEAKPAVVALGQADLGGGELARVLELGEVPGEQVTVDDLAAHAACDHESHTYLCLYHYLLSLSLLLMMYTAFV